MKKSSKTIISFATLGTVVSTFIVRYAFYFLLSLFQLEIPLIYCLLFGVLISPTDPIAVMSLLKKANLSKEIEANIVGQSLFNDGIGVVIFAALLQIAATSVENFGIADIRLQFLKEAVGGIVADFILGYTGYRLMKSIGHSQNEILISLAMVMGGYSLCHYLHVSGSLAPYNLRNCALYGLIILATNFKSNIDTGFLRRFQLLMEFKKTNKEERLLRGKTPCPMPPIFRFNQKTSKKLFA